MKHNTNVPHRKSIRLKGYNYSQNGAYFVTICTDKWFCLFGNIEKGEIQLNKYGEIVFEEWQQSSTIRKEIELDEFTIMPNHIHGIVIINNVTNAPQTVGAKGTSPDTNSHAQQAKGPSPLQRPTFRMKPKSLSSFMSGFKSSVTKRINILRNTPGAPMWQRNYYEHIIRNEYRLNRIREYIINNPLKWHLDRENPERQGRDKLEDEIFNYKEKQ